MALDKTTTSMPTTETHAAPIIRSGSGNSVCVYRSGSHRDVRISGYHGTRGIPLSTGEALLLRDALVEDFGPPTPATPEKKVPDPLAEHRDLVVKALAVVAALKNSDFPGAIKALSAVPQSADAILDLVAAITTAAK